MGGDSKMRRCPETEVRMVTRVPARARRRANSTVGLMWPCKGKLTTRKCATAIWVSSLKGSSKTTQLRFLSACDLYSSPPITDPIKPTPEVRFYMTANKSNQNEQRSLLSSTNALMLQSKDPPSSTASLVNSLHFLAFLLISSPPITSSKHLFSSPPSKTPSSFTFTLTPVFQTSSIIFAFVV
ncbi:hypothetical protein CKAN_01608600 [Cinnamomum micranthum f. kanehirae]|uniref:Uncharacterized protein n=1 Tax=Cinnamomum micranthum f. kanehirae TaxID=337451 RepID=A0A443P8S1_9MAGN|nr:hypothetical protein CKAN_01608600 [Cinnamomum micranthum f. kanehirae]